MEFSLKQVFKKNWLAIVTACITAGILIYFLVTTDGINAFRAVVEIYKFLGSFCYLER